MSTTAVGPSQNGRGASSTQTNRGAPHQSPWGHLHQNKSFKAMLSLIKSKCKTGMKKLMKTNPQQRKRSWLESNKKLRGSSRNKSLSWEGKQMLSASKPRGSTSTENGRGLRRYKHRQHPSPIGVEARTSAWPKAASTQRQLPPTTSAIQSHPSATQPHPSAPPASITPT
jgi:hypothetical protein